MNTAIIGASGYAGEETVRILSRHPRLKITAVTSRQFKGKTLGAVVGGLTRNRDILFEDLSPEQVAERADLFVLAVPHGVASEYAVPLRKAGKLVVDLSADFRLHDPAVYEEFYGHPHPSPELLKESVYALPELHADAIRKADLIASPGCYPTSILLALAPAVQEGLIDLATISITSLSGVTGAGKKAEIPLLHGEIGESAKAYGIPKHRHLSEIEQELALLAGKPVRVSFVPHLIPINRGILTTITAQLVQPPEIAVIAAIQALYEEAYRNAPFVRVLAADAPLPEVKNVARTNVAEIALRVDPRTGRLIVISAIDNLVKGTAGQAVQAINLRLGWPEDEGLL
ncbi:N-acetyl-gamma-glutamyl-phosphate reductase [Verrucomicrobium sp. GAS474]|uniref:N-acetyl-gamma-glutamyl-phosphate reductase n=1 Tax=Verrucomicrobium sp. GAS474 TaxID=1882831 RepID=UPI000879B766|nr:N-acetyl-gamma-glutamyl-phosphate reductase [Verrucomicrobium sp. GAS474]SDU03479.1 N-acetyl-gamma-glutamyl-phosphate reductase [Verrucomicrobium sp. GAS474]